MGQEKRMSKVWTVGSGHTGVKCLEFWAPGQECGQIGVPI